MQIHEFYFHKSFEMVRVDSWDTESSAAISLKFEWRFWVIISLTSAILTSVEDVDGRSYSEANLPLHLDRFWMHCTTHMHVFLIKSIHSKLSVKFSAIPHTKFHLQCKIWNKFFVRHSYQLEKSRNTLEINWQHRALWTN